MKIESKSLFIAIILLGACAAFAAPLAQFAEPIDQPAGAWAYSERPMRIFSPRESLMDPSQMIREVETFHATSIRWVYLRLTSEAEKRYADQNGYAKFGARLHEAGLVWGGAASSGAVNNNPDAQDRTYLGELLNVGDTTSPAYRSFMIADVKRYIDARAVQVHFDDPDRTLGAVKHLTGGGFSETAVAKFRDYLRGNFRPAQLRRWDIDPDAVADGTFDFADYVKAADGPEAVKKTHPELWDVFTDFHAGELKMFYEYVKEQIVDYAEKTGYPYPVVFTCNNTSLIRLEGAPYDFGVFDYLMGETSARYTPQTARRIYEIIHRARAMGSMQYFLASNDWFCISEEWSPENVRVPNRFDNAQVVREFNRYLAALDRAGNDPAKILVARKTLEQTLPGSLVAAVMARPDWQSLLGTAEAIDPVGRALYVQRSRRLIAVTYALGSATLVPYDRWIRGYDDIRHGVRFFGTYGEFGDIYRHIKEYAGLYDGYEEVFATGPALGGEFRARKLPESAVPIALAGGSGGLFACVRAKPEDMEAPVVVHLVDWKADVSESPESLTGSFGREPFQVTLDNRLFGAPAGDAMKMYLLRPGFSPVRLAGRPAPGGKTLFDIPTLQPCGLLTTSLP